MEVLVQGKANVVVGSPVAVLPIHYFLSHPSSDRAHNTNSAQTAQDTCSVGAGKLGRWSEHRFPRVEIGAATPVSSQCGQGDECVGKGEAGLHSWAGIPGRMVSPGSCCQQVGSTDS
jgi:hypothetical protein